MLNKIKLIYITFILVIFAGPVFVSAGFEINEIMYDLEGTDTNREWIEVKNTGNEPADLSKWFFFSDNSKHSLTPQGSPNVPAGGYAVITQNATNFQADWPDYNGLIFDSSWTGFNNESGETISMKDPALNEVSIVTFDSSMGGAGDGKSLQKVSGSWSGASPTPGMANQSGPPDEDEEPGEEEGGGGGGSSPPKVVAKKVEVEVPKMATNIIAKNTIFAGIPSRFDSNTIGLKKETLKVGTLVWNFGDGMSRKTSEHMPFEYTYQYPGEYVMTLSYYYPHDTILDATDRMIIKVTEPGVVISSVGKGADPYIEIENKSGFEVDMSGWVVKGGASAFYIPEGTIILPSKSIRFSSKVTGFSSSDTAYVNIFSTSGEAVASYPVAKAVTPTSTRSTVYTPTAISKVDEASSVINLDELGASAANAKTGGIPSSSYAWLGLLGVLAIGATTILLIRNKANKEKDIDEEINVNDIKIME